MDNVSATTFDYREQPYRSTLKEDRIVIDAISRHGTWEILFSEYVDSDSKKWVFDHFGNEWMLLTPLHDNGYNNPVMDFFDVDFARFLVTQGLPEHLAIRLAVKAIGMSNGEELFRNYRKLKIPFFFKTTTGESAFEYYILLSKKFDMKVADKILMKSSSSLEEISKLFHSFMKINVHPAASGYISDFSPESFEAFVLFSKFMYFENRQDAIVVTRLLAETDEFDWNVATRLVDRLAKDSDLSDLVRPEEKHLAANFRDNDYRTSITRMFYFNNSVSGAQTDWNYIFAVLIEKYGLQTMTDSIEKLKVEASSYEQTFSNFVIVADYLNLTGDYETPLAWIVSLNSEIDPTDAEQDEYLQH